MPEGIIIYDEESTGTWSTLDQMGVVLQFDTAKQRETFLELASENGVALSFLETPELDGE